MAVEVTVALVGDPDAPPPGAVSQTEFRKPWGERPATVLTVEESSSLASVIDQAAEQLDCRPWDGFATAHESFPFIAFCDESDPTPLEERMTLELALVDEQGQAMWGVQDTRLVPYGRILRSAEAGTIHGDPTRLYLIRRHPQASGVPGDWNLVLQAWDILRYAMAATASAYGTIKAVGAIRERVERGRAAVTSNAPRWLRKRGRPEDVAGLLGRRPWRSRDLATVLGCTDQEAEGVLGVFGFAYDADQAVWRYAAGEPDQGVEAEDQAARFLVGYLGEVAANYSDMGELPSDEVAAVARAALDDVATGRLGAFPHEKERARSIEALQRYEEEADPYDDDQPVREGEYDQGLFEESYEEEVWIAAPVLFGLVLVGLVVAFGLDARWFVAIPTATAVVAVLGALLKLDPTRRGLVRVSKWLTNDSG